MIKIFFVAPHYVRPKAVGYLAYTYIQYGIQYLNVEVITTLNTKFIYYL